LAHLSIKCTGRPATHSDPAFLRKHAQAVLLYLNESKLPSQSRRCRFEHSFFQMSYQARLTKCTVVLSLRMDAWAGPWDSRIARQVRASEPSAVWLALLQRILNRCRTPSLLWIGFRAA
jgi:hypothetical protein